MALRMRNAIRKTTDQENINGIAKAKTTTTGITKRSALGEISNVQARQASNLLNEATKKKEIVKQTVVKKSTTSTTTLTHTTKLTSQSRSLLCKTSTLLEPSKPIYKSTVPSTTGPSVGPAVLPKPRARLPLRSTTASAPSATLKVKAFAPARVDAPVVPKNANFKDIDKEAISNPTFLGEYAGEIYAFMRAMEVNFLVKKDFLHDQLITSKMRALVVDWLVDVQLQYSLLTETLHLAIGIFDRFLQKYRTIEKTQLQLVGVTAMWIASKYEELFAPELENFVYITDRTYKKKEIIKMEELMHKTLDFCYGQPLSIYFLRRYTNSSEADARHHTYGKFFLELALVNYTLRSYRPSLVAAAALYISFCILNDGNKIGRQMWPECLEFYSTYSYDDIVPCVAIFAKAILEAEKAKLQAVQRKYSSAKQMQVSKAVYLQVDVLKKLAGIEN